MSQFVSSFIIRLLSAATAGGLTGRRTARLPVEVSLADFRWLSRGAGRPVAGLTCDLSGAGLSFILPTAFVGGYHVFCGGGAVLRVGLQLPDGPLEMKARAVRYDAADGATGYVVGATILEMSAQDRARYQQFLRGPAKARGDVAAATMERGQLSLSSQSGR
jgi:hypothetical protein